MPDERGDDADGLAAGFAGPGAGGTFSNRELPFEGYPPLMTRQWAALAVPAGETGGRSASRSMPVCAMPRKLQGSGGSAPGVPAKKECRYFVSVANKPGVHIETMSWGNLSQWISRERSMP